MLAYLRIVRGVTEEGRVARRKKRWLGYPSGVERQWSERQWGIWEKVRLQVIGRY